MQHPLLGHAQIRREGLDDGALVAQHDQFPELEAALSALEPPIAVRYHEGQRAAESAQLLLTGPLELQRQDVAPEALRRNLYEVDQLHLGTLFALVEEEVVVNQLLWTVAVAGVEAQARAEEIDEMLVEVPVQNFGDQRALFS